MKNCIFVVLFAVSVLALYPQNGGNDAAKEGPPISSEFGGIRLGSPLSAVQEALKSSPYFFYRGEKDVSFLPKKPETIIDCEGRFQVKRGIFQFEEDKLFTMIIQLETSKLDYFTLFSTLSRKYGNPLGLDPQSAFWDDGKTRITLEKPLTVKYIDLAIFEARNEKAKVEKSVEESSREKFLEMF